jgi:hypothetical protein
MKEMKPNRNDKFALALVAGLILTVPRAHVTACGDAIGQNGQCPSFTPTSPGTCFACSTYYTYSPITTYECGDVLGPCVNCHSISVSVAYTQHDNEIPNTCVIVGTVCRYIPTEKSASCSTATCDDWCNPG